MMTVDEAIRFLESRGYQVTRPLLELEPPKESSRFDDVWSAYPRKVGKKPARKAWDKAAREMGETVLRDAVLRALKWQIREIDVEFFPHLATYLNQARWEDEPRSQAKRSAYAARDPRMRVL